MLQVLLSYAARTAAALFLCLTASGLFAQTSNCFSIHIGKVASQHNDTVFIPVSAEGFTQVLSMQAAFTWNTEQLELVGIAAGPGNPLKLEQAINFSAHIPGQLRFIWYDAVGKSVADHATLFGIYMRVISSKSGFAPIQIESIPGMSYEVASIKENDIAFEPLNYETGGVETNGKAASPIRLKNTCLTIGDCTKATSAVQLAVEGGVPPYTFNWTNTEGFTSTNPNLANIFPGTYQLTVTDQAGNSASGRFRVVKPDQDISAIPMIEQPSCDKNACVQILINGNTPGNYSVNWSDMVTTSNFKRCDLPFGNHSITITNGFGCKTEVQFSINTMPGDIKINETIKSFDCATQTGGSITVKPTGTFQSVSYKWSTGETSSVITNLPIGTYSLTLTTNSGCQLEYSFNIPHTPLPELEYIVEDVACSLGQPGSINLVSKPTMPNLTYKWSNGQTTPSLFDLAAGTYSVTISNSPECRKSYSFDVKDITAWTLESSVQYASNGSATASLYMKQTQNLPLFPVVLNWSFGKTVKVDQLPANGFLDIVSDIQPGSHTVTIVDAFGCKQVNTIVINPPPSAGNQTCMSFQIGKVSGKPGDVVVIPVQVQGFSKVITMLFDMVWDETQLELVDLDMGNNPIMMDKKWNFNTSFSSGLRCVWDDVTLQGRTLADGTAIFYLKMRVKPGAADFASISIIRPASSSIVFEVYIQEGNDDIPQNLICEIGGVELTKPNVSGLHLTQVCARASSNCFTANGFIQLAASGGTPPYAYQWIGPNGIFANTAYVDGLKSGLYRVVVTDAVGDVTSAVVDLRDDKNSYNVFKTIKNASCGLKGCATLQIEDGSAPFTIKWSDNVNQKLSRCDLAGGAYTVTVTDSKGCSVVEDFTIKDWAQPSITSQVTNISCDLSVTGAISITSVYPNDQVTYQWSTGETTSSINNLAPGHYWAYIQSGKTCKTLQKFEVKEVTPWNFTVTKQHKPGASTFAAQISMQPGVYNPSFPMSVEWSNGRKQTVTSWPSDNILDEVTDLPLGVYKVSITDASGCLHLEIISNMDMSSPTVSQNSPNQFLTSKNGEQFSTSEGAGVNERLETASVTEIQVRPNPVYDRLLVSWPAGELTSVQLFSATGQLVRELQAEGNDSGMIDVSDLAAGPYWLRASSRNGVVVKLVIVE